jgi:hypothetical protein
MTLRGIKLELTVRIVKVEMKMNQKIYIINVQCHTCNQEIKTLKLIDFQNIREQNCFIDHLG